MSDLAKVTRKQLLALPRATMQEQIRGVECRSVILIPTEEIHDSGYRIIEIAMVNMESEPFALHCEHIDAISFRSPMASDCIECGLMRFWCDVSHVITVSGSSSVAIEGKEEKQ